VAIIEALRSAASWLERHGYWVGALLLAVTILVVPERLESARIALSALALVSLYYGSAARTVRAFLEGWRETPSPR
jgi:hypothetical protein